MSTLLGMSNIDEMLIRFTLSSLLFLVVSPERYTGGVRGLAVPGRA